MNYLKYFCEILNRPKKGEVLVNFSYLKLKRGKDLLKPLESG